MRLLPKLSLPVWLLILFAFVVSVRLLLVSLSGIYPITTTLEPRNPDHGLDSGEYNRYAKNLAFHGTFSHSEHAPFHPSAFRTPVYPLFLAPFFRFASSDAQALLWITLAQICLAGISSLLLYAIAVRMTGNRVLSWAAAAIASLDLFTIRLTYMIATETLFITLLLATTLVFLRYLERASLIHLAWSMVLLVCAGLCRPLALFFLPVFLCFVIWRQSNPRGHLKRRSRNQTRWRDGSDVVPIHRAAPTHSAVRTASQSLGDRGHDVGAVAPAQPANSQLSAILLAISVFSLCLTPWMLRNWQTMSYFTVYTNGSFMNAFLANGLLTVKNTGNPLPKLKLDWKPLDQMIADSLDELNATVGTKVSYDANMRHLLALDHPEFTKQFESIFQSKTDRILRETRMARLKSSLVTFVSMPFWSPREPLCRLLGEKNTVGLSEIVHSARKRNWSEARAYISEFKCCRIVGYIWTFGYLVCLNVFGLIGFGIILLRGRSSSHRGSAILHPLSSILQPVPRGRGSKDQGNEVAGHDTLLTSRATKSAGSIHDRASRMRWTFLAVLPFVLMAAPSWGTAVGWEMARFRAPAIPFIAVFAVIGFDCVCARIKKRKQSLDALQTVRS